MSKKGRFRPKRVKILLLEGGNSWFLAVFWKSRGGSLKPLKSVYVVSEWRIRRFFNVPTDEKRRCWH